MRSNNFNKKTAYSDVQLRCLAISLGICLKRFTLIISIKKAMKLELGL